MSEEKIIKFTNSADLFEILKKYRRQNLQEESGDGCRLVDILTPPEEENIRLGDEELHRLADFIAGEIDDAFDINENKRSRMNDTPRTDEILQKIYDQTAHVGEHNCPKIWVDLARELERENAREDVTNKRRIMNEELEKALLDRGKYQVLSKMLDIIKKIQFVEYDGRLSRTVVDVDTLMEKMKELY
jgi:hypothetical protein